MNQLFQKISLLIVLVLLTFNSSSSQTLPKLYINEFMASNSNSFYDYDFGEYSDWIEIYNAESYSVDLNGYYLSDKISEPAKWKFTSRFVIPPHRYVIVWADEKDSANHTNFKLSKEEDAVILSDNMLREVDKIEYKDMEEDISYGRFPDGSTLFNYFVLPTPESKNTDGSLEILSKPKFSMKSGFYTGTQFLELTSDNPLATINYTLDGSVPTDTSLVYSQPIELTKTTVVRAISTKTDCIYSDVKTNSYFINESTTLPVVSIATDPKNFFNDQTGIYVVGTNGITGYCSDTKKNWNQDWERPISLELFENDGSRAFQIDAGVKIGGGCTRKYDQKPLAVYARSKYGDSKIKYQIFKDKPIQSLNNILLRNTGQDWYRTLIRDGLMHSIVKGRMDIDLQAYRPSIVFLNGEYWGIHDIREKHNEHYIEANHGIDDDSVDLVVGNAEVKEGSAGDYTALINYLKSNNVQSSPVYEYVKTKIDIDEYINYFIAEVFYGNYDWPANNIKYWKPQTAGGKWRWILFDTDLGFGAHGSSPYNANNLEMCTSPTPTYYANPTWSTYLFRTMLTNVEFHNEFSQRMMAHLNTTFKTERLKYFIDSIKTIVESEIPRHKQRWEKSLSFFPTWQEGLNVLYEFAEKRAPYVIKFMRERFGFSGEANLALNIEGKGKVYFNGVECDNNNFSGSFFKNIPLKLIAVPDSGYSFSGWSGIINSTQDTTEIVLTSDSQLTALFEVATGVEEENIVNTFKLEQNYPNPFNPTTQIKFTLPNVETSYMTSLRIYNILGKEIVTLINKELSAGTYDVEFSATSAGSNLSSGIYFYQLRAGDFVSTKKMLMIK
ncbi:MAG: T9SS C-terminal target domain-containing protein [Ignavibacteriales bacterium]|nr:MAG: T9SS C-terminal target domain-containing protein [Ignavibacteriales bacterium]